MPSLNTRFLYPSAYSTSPHGQLISTSKLTSSIQNFWYSLIFPINLLILLASPSPLITIPAIHSLKPKLLELSLTLLFLSYHMDKPVASRFVSNFKIYLIDDYFSTPPLLSLAQTTIINSDSLLIGLPTSTFVAPLAYSTQHPERCKSLSKPSYRSSSNSGQKPKSLRSPVSSRLTCTHPCMHTHLNALTASATLISFIFLEFVSILISGPLRLSPLPGILSPSDTPDDFLTSFRSLLNHWK